ncbi:MAG: PAS domain-containing sensor histidine kinase [bacterium]|nr:PAS domain-containing sensor histidine kinase [bacterium]
MNNKIKVRKNNENEIVHLTNLKWTFLLFLCLIIVFFLIEDKNFYLYVSLGIVSFLCLINLIHNNYARKERTKPIFSVLIIGLDIISLSVVIFLNREYLLRFTPYIYSLLIIEYSLLKGKRNCFLLATLFSLLYASIAYVPCHQQWLNVFGLDWKTSIFSSMNYYEITFHMGFIYIVAFLMWYLNKQKDLIFQEKDNLIDNLYQTNKILAKTKDEIKAYNQTLKIRLETQQITRDAIRHAYHTIETIVENIGSGLVIINKEGKIVVFNKQAEKITGFTALEALNKKCSDIIKNDLCLKNCPFGSTKEDVFLSSGYGIILCNKFNEKIPVIINHSSLKDEEGNTIGAVEVFTDISKLNEVKEMGSEFLSLVSHELKAPLTVIKGYASVLLKEKLGRINQPQKERLAKIEQYVDKLSEIVSNLLEFSKITAENIKLDKISLTKIIKEVVDTFKQELKNRDLDLKLKENGHSYYILGDAPIIERVFVNLINNAIKYTSPKGKISIEVEEEKDIVNVYITDNGIGILPEDMPKIFDKFYRSSVVSLDKEGTGLGLSIVKKVLDIHGANIKVSSEINKGTQFCVSFNKIMV